MEHMDDKIYMARALELANLGRGQVSPNPMVGCVVVLNGEIIGKTTKSRTNYVLNWLLIS